MLLSCGYIVLVLNIISKLGRELKTERNISRFGTIYEDTNYQKHKNRMRLTQYYLIVFLGRRLLYVLIILLLYEVPIVQQSFNIAIHTFTFIYDITMRPFQFNLLGTLIYFYDLILAIIFGSIPLYMVYPDNADQIGRAHIYLMIVVISISWVTIIGTCIYTIYKKLKGPTTSEIVTEIVQNLRKNERDAIYDLPILPIRVRKGSQAEKKPKMWVLNKRFSKKKQSRKTKKIFIKRKTSANA